MDKREIGELMEGRPIARATTSDAQWAYTLYVRENGTAFVHQLDTVNAGALCVDLPDEIRAATAADANAWRIATTGSSGGFVVNGRLQFLAKIATGDVTATVRLAGSSLVELAAALAGDAFLLGPEGIMPIDATLQAARAWPGQGLDRLGDDAAW